MDAAHALDALFKPRSIAVIGAGRTVGTIGNTILWNIVSNGFEGKVFPVNPKADSVRSIRCYADVRDIPDPVDLAIIAVPQPFVLEAVKHSIEKGAKGICVITAGFREVGPAGAAAERQLVELCRAAGVRMIGPNCMGLLNTEDAVRMNGTFARTFPRPGGIAFLSQSGAMGVTILDHAEDLGIGIRMFASLGNKADVSGNDLLRYWQDDPKTTVALMYLESFGNPRHFIPIARRFTRTKPIVCVKAGRTAEGSKAASSHTGALSGPDAAAEAILEQTGVLRVDSVSEMFDVAQALVSQPLPAGPRVALLTNAGGPAILATDFLVGKGLELATLSEATKDALRRVLPPEASVANPVDMIASAGVKEYGAALPLILADPGVDLVITIFVPPITLDPLGVARSIFEASRGASKPVLGCLMARDAVIAEIKRLDEAWFPLYDFPEDAVRAAWNLVRVRALRDDDLGEPVRFDVKRQRVTELLAAKAEAGGGWMGADDAFEILEAYGIRCPKIEIAHDVAGVVAAAARAGGPVAVKLDGAAFLHKSDVGAVVLGVSGAEAAKAAGERLLAVANKVAGGTPWRFVVQKMAKPGTELVMGVRSDPVFGPLLLVGLGGVYVEILKDVQFGLVPLTPVLATRLLRRLRAFPLLKGVRGRKPVDIASVEQALLRLSQLVEEHPSILEIEMNPVVARPDGVEALDVRLRVAALVPGGARLPVAAPV